MFDLDNSLIVFPLLFPFIGVERLIMIPDICILHCFLHDCMGMLSGGFVGGRRCTEVCAHPCPLLALVKGLQKIKFILLLNV
jgi:hypothetical protein